MLPTLLYLGAGVVIALSMQCTLFFLNREIERERAAVPDCIGEPMGAAARIHERDEYVTMMAVITLLWAVAEASTLPPSLDSVVRILAAAFFTLIHFVAFVRLTD